MWVLSLIYGKEWNKTTLQKISKKDWIALTIVAVLAGAVVPGLVFQALAITGVNNIILIGRLQLPLTIFLSIWLLQEQVNRWQIMGAFTALIGVILTVVLQTPEMKMINMEGAEVGLGEILVAMSAVISGVSTIIIKKSLSHIPIGIFSIFRTALGTVIFFFIALILYGKNHFMDVFSPFLWKWMLVYGAIIVVLGQLFSLKGLRATTVSEASLAGSFTPVVSILSAYLVLGEVPTLAQYIGGSVVIFGIFLSQVGVHNSSRLPK
ncbi:DMT family transporter [Dolichospermum sp. UHCC 0259]|uniref:DMT family transporter n=1 Tax=Dolichospermum sp. UHCC 0259 TaxID=2590010 RepID=UPI0014450DC6|nr:DMT family transporter [Dolichospermum sp. UHCC 0259]